MACRCNSRRIWNLTDAGVLVLHVCFASPLFSEHKSFTTFFCYTDISSCSISAVQLQPLTINSKAYLSIYTIMSALEPIVDKSNLAMNGLLELGLDGSSSEAATFQSYALVAPRGPSSVKVPVVQNPHM